MNHIFYRKNIKKLSAPPPLGMFYSFVWFPTFAEKYLILMSYFFTLFYTELFMFFSTRGGITFIPRFRRLSVYTFVAPQCTVMFTMCVFTTFIKTKFRSYVAFLKPPYRICHKKLKINRVPGYLYDKFFRRDNVLS